MKKSNLLKTLAVLSVCCVGGGVLALGGFNATVADVTLSTTDVLFMDGASIRFMQEGETAETSTAGIRFEARIAKAAWEDSGITEIGMLFLPVSEGEVTAANYSLETENVWKEVVYGGEETRDGRFSVTEESVEYYALRAYLYGIPVSEYGNAIQARAYAIAGGETYYTEEVCTRSIAGVAAAALRDTKEAEEATGDYIYEIADGVWSPYSETQRTSLQGYLVGATDPTVTVPADMQRKYHVGDTIDLSGITAKDWLGEALDVTYEVTTGDDPVTVINDGVEVKAYTDYTVKVTAEDADGRTASETVTFYVYQENEFAFFNTEATVAEEVITAGGLTAEYSTAYAKEGAGSLKIGTDGGSTIGLKFTNTANVDWDNTNGLTFYVYNPTDYEYRISVVGFTPADGTGLSGSLRINAWAKPGEWTKVAVSADNIVTTLNGESNLLGILMECLYNDDDTTNSTSNTNSQEWLGMELYLDAFTLDEEYSWEQTLLGATTATIYTKTGLEEITVDNVKKTAAYAQLNKTYMRPGATFGDIPKVTANEQITFKLYSTLTNSIHIGLYANDKIYCGGGTTYIKPVGIASGEVVEVTVDGSVFNETVKYLGFYVDCDWNGGNNDTTKAWWDSGRLYFYDFAVSAKTADTATDDYKWAVSEVIGNTKSLVNTDSAFVYTDGDAFTAENNKYSIFTIGYNGNWPEVWFSESANVDWANYESVSFKIYNPSVATINIAVYSSVASGTKLKLTTVAAVGKQWTTVTVEPSSWAAGTKLGITPAYADNENNVLSAGWLAWKQRGVYIDAFTFVEMPQMTAGDTNWTQFNTSVGQGSWTASVNTDKTYVTEGECSVWAKPNGTWDKIAFTYGTEIDWTKVTSLSFDIYNANSTDIVMGTSIFVAFKNTWTTVVLDATQLGKMIDETYGLIIYTAHGANGKVEFDGVTYTNPANSEWTAAIANGFYFDNFVITYAS